MLPLSPVPFGLRIFFYSCLLASGMTWANDPQIVSVAAARQWKQECGACHIAYPPYMLPPESWRKLMRDLDRHFDTDASLSVGVTREISEYLVKHAANPKYYGAAPLRITETDRFRQEHDKIEVAVIKHPAVRSLANCQVCHPGAERENFDEHELRIPR